MHISPLILSLPEVMYIVALLSSFKVIVVLEGENIGFIAATYVLTSLVIIVCGTALSSIVVWMMRRILLCGSVRPGQCHVHSLDFARRWLAQELYHRNDTLLQAMKRSVIRRILMRFMGASLDSVVDSYVPDPSEPDLFSCKDDVLGANGVVVRSFKIDSFGNVTIGKRCKILD